MEVSNPLALWREFAAYFRPHRLLLAGVVIAGAAQSFSYVPLALVLRDTFDTILPKRDLAGLWIAVGELLVLQVIGLLLAWWIGRAALRISQDVVAQVRRRAIERLYELPRSYHTAADAEHMHVTLVHETSWVEAMGNVVTSQLLPSLLSASVLLLLLVWADPLYALILAVGIPVLVAVDRLVSRWAWYRQARLRAAFEDFSRSIRFAISALDLTRFQACEADELKRQDAKIEHLRHRALELAHSDATQQLLQGALLLTSTLAVLVAGGWAVTHGGMTSGQVMAFYVMAGLFTARIRTLFDCVPMIRRGTEAFGQLSALLAAPHPEPYSGTRQIDGIEDLRMKDVGFAYPEGPEVIADASIEIRRGELALLAGTNGSGKSTLLYLMAALYRPQRGTLTVNGVPYEEIDPKSLRSRMAVVPQHPYLFADTVRANVTYGQEDASEEAIWEALEWANAAGFVRELQNGLDSPVGERGVLLSGGQRQKLAIARAFLRRPHLLVLDEPTTHLDEAGIEHLMSTLERLPFHPATMLVSHERSVLNRTARLWVLSGGRLQESALQAPLQ